MKSIKKLTLFISCPSDITAELDIIDTVVLEINKTSGEQQGYVIETIDWRHDTYSGAATDAQEVINQQVNHRYDVLVGIIWGKLGTPTMRDKSGTVEEITFAVNHSEKAYLLYFNIESPRTLKELNFEELFKVKAFKEDLSSKGVLFKEYDSARAFESLFRVNLTNIISDRFFSKNEDSEVQPPVPLKKKYSEIQEILDAVENKVESEIDEVSIFEVVEETLGSFVTIGLTIGSMGKSIDTLNERMLRRTDELNKFKTIRDERLRNRKLEVVIGLMATELDDFNDKMTADFPAFSESMSSIAPQYSKVLLFAKSYNVPGQKELVDSLLAFRDSVEMATSNCAKMLTEILKWPPVNPKLNKSKRTTEIVLKNLVKEMLNSLELLNEVI